MISLVIKGLFFAFAILCLKSNNVHYETLTYVQRINLYTYTYTNVNWTLLIYDEN